jgi:hypothetical protein
MASDRTPREHDPTPRRPWRTPTLIEYGHIGKLTQGSSGNNSDGDAKKK